MPASRKRGSGGGRPSPRVWGSDSSPNALHTPSSAMEGLALSSPNRGSPTPRAQQVIDLCSPSPSPPGLVERAESPGAESPIEWDYGGAPDLEFDPGYEYDDNDWLLRQDSPREAPEDDIESVDSSAPSVSRSDAGLELSDSEWGGNAVLVWDGQGYSEEEDFTIVGGVSPALGTESDKDEDEMDEEEDEDEEEEELGEDDYEVHDISVSDDEELALTKMPDYATWDVPKLQVYTLPPLSLTSSV